MMGIVVVDLAVAWQWRTGHANPYPYWLETSAGAVAYGGVGALIASRVPGNRMGPLMLVVPLCAAVQGITGVLAQEGALRAWPRPAVVLLGGLFSITQVTVVGFVTLLLLLAPDGRPWNRFWRACARIVVVATVMAGAGALISGPEIGGGPDPQTDSLPGFPHDAVLVPGLRDAASAISQSALLVTVVMIVLAMVALGQRWWQSPPALRQQVTWPILGAVATPLVIVVMIPVPYPTIYHGDPVWAAAVTMLPLGIAIGVFRHGLYGLDRIVSRTVSYAIVTGTVLAVYAAVVTVATRALPVTNDLAVAAATLAAAAVARPVLRRVQGAVDRRFDREKVDAQHAVESFGRGLVEQVDADRTQQDLVATTSRLLSPSSVGLWTAKP
jgi:hypothetical protein